MGSERRSKVLLAKMGLDVHDNGIQTLAAILRDAGMEVVYLGLFNSPESIVRSAMEEDVDVVGLSFHAPSYLAHVSELMGFVAQNNGRFLVICGGIIKSTDIVALKQLGVAEVFPPGSSKGEIIEFIRGTAVSAH